jgi:hypothetical protein
MLPTLGQVLGVIAIIFIVDALFFEGKLRRWAWDRARNKK